VTRRLAWPGLVGFGLHDEFDFAPAPGGLSLKKSKKMLRQVEEPGDTNGAEGSSTPRQFGSTKPILDRRLFLRGPEIARRTASSGRPRGIRTPSNIDTPWTFRFPLPMFLLFRSARSCARRDRPFSFAFRRRRARSR